MSRYSLPSMTEIASLPFNGLSHASTFSGCGGTCLGFRMAGFRTLWANDSDPNAQKAYARNHPGAHLDGRDIREVSAEDILAATGLRRGELDLLEGSPPCTAFSMAGVCAKKWGGVPEHAGAARVRVENLSFEFVRLLGGLMPRAFCVENVPAWGTGASAAYLHETVRRMRKLGYDVRRRVLNAHWYGVPQDRRRLIIVGARDGIAPPFPEPGRARYSLRDAVPGATRVEGYEFYKATLRSPERPYPTVLASGPRSGCRVCVEGVVRDLTIAELKRVARSPMTSSSRATSRSSGDDSATRCPHCSREPSPLRWPKLSSVLTPPGRRPTWMPSAALHPTRPDLGHDLVA
jgi:DNA (cytosine-5)-methyltransferase 1